MDYNIIDIYIDIFLWYSGPMKAVQFAKFTLTLFQIFGYLNLYSSSGFVLIFHITRYQN